MFVPQHVKVWRNSIKCFVKYVETSFSKTARKAPNVSAHLVLETRYSAVTFLFLQYTS